MMGEERKTLELHYAVTILIIEVIYFLTCYSDADTGAYV